MQMGEYLATGIGHVFDLTFHNERPLDWKPIGTRVRHPWTWARDVHMNGLPTFDRGLANVHLLGTRAWGHIASIPDLPFAGARLYLAELCGLHPNGIEPCTPSRRFSYEVRGQRFPQQIALKSVEDEHLRGVFLDPRDIESEVVFICLPQRPMSLDQICRHAEVLLPRGWHLTVEGAVLYTPEAQLVTFGQRTVLTIVAHGFVPHADASDSGDDDDQNDTHDHGPNDDDKYYDGDEATSDDESSVDEDRSRSPTRHDGTPDDPILLPLCVTGCSAEETQSQQTQARTVVDEAKKSLQI